MQNAARRTRPIAAWLLPLGLVLGGPAAAEWRWPAVGEPTQALAVFVGEGTERDFSETLRRVADFQGSSDRLVAIAYGHVLAHYGDRLSLEAEVLYGRHFGRQTYHEVGAALNLRLHRLPWHDVVRSSLAIGIGPSYVSTRPELERGGGDRECSRLLNQFNLEATVALPEYERTELLLRLQHRSGAFGLIGGVTDASTFVTVGVRRRF